MFAHVIRPGKGERSYRRHGSSVHDMARGILGDHAGHEAANPVDHAKGVHPELPFVVFDVGGGYINTASGADHSFVLTGGLGLKVWLFTLDLAGGASPSSAEVKAEGDKFPSRVNLSMTLGLRGNF